MTGHVLQMVVLSTFLVGLPVSSAVFQPDPVADLQIRNKLSLYALALDTKNFGLLAEVFSANVTAYVPLPPPNDVLHGLPSLQKSFQSALGNIITQHTLSTTVIDFSSLSQPTKVT